MGRDFNPKTRGLILPLPFGTLSIGPCVSQITLRIMKSQIKDADMSRSEFINTNLQGSRFHDVNLSGAEFVDINLSGTTFEDVALTRVTLRNVNCSHLTIEDACYEGMLIDGILVTELLRVFRSQQA